MGLIFRKLWGFLLIFSTGFTSLISYLFFLNQSLSSILLTAFDAISSSKDEVLSINPSSNIFNFGDLNVHRKDWLTCSGETDRPVELYYDFSISNGLTQIFNIPTGIPDHMVNFPFWICDCDSHSLSCSYGRISFFWPYYLFYISFSRNSDHSVVSASIDFLSNSKNGCLFSWYSLWLLLCSLGWPWCSFENYPRGGYL